MRIHIYCGATSLVGYVSAVRLRRKSVKRAKKKITAAVYEYQADCDGEWGEIQFDFVNGTAEIVQLAEWDTMNSHVFAKQAIQIAQKIQAIPPNASPRLLAQGEELLAEATICIEAFPAIVNDTLFN